MSKRNIHTVPHDNGWANHPAGSIRASGIYPTKGVAARGGREMARRDQVEHLVHRRDGTIGERNSYGNDPYPPRG